MNIRTIDFHARHGAPTSGSSDWSTKKAHSRRIGDRRKRTILLLNAGVDDAHAAHFLAPYGMTVEDLPSLVRALGDDECLLLSGSVAEGLANPDSDVDMLLIGRPAGVPGLVLGDQTVDVSSIMHDCGLEVSVEVYEPAHVERLADRMQALVATIDRPDEVERLSLIQEEVDQKLLHRVRTGIPLVNPHVAQAWREKLRSDRLPEVMALTRIISHFSLREDAISHVEQDDYRTASWCLMLCATDLGAALLASIGETSHNLRWVIRLLERNRDAFGPVDAEAFIELLLTRLTSAGQLDDALALFDVCLIEVAGRLPNLIPLCEKLGSTYPLHTHRIDPETEAAPDLVQLVKDRIA